MPLQRPWKRNTISYFHMVGTCPMGPVLDADCRVHGIANLRVADASVMPTIPRGNTYLGCVMVAERVARKILADVSVTGSDQVCAWKIRQWISVFPRRNGYFLQADGSSTKRDMPQPR